MLARLAAAAGSAARGVRYSIEKQNMADPISHLVIKHQANLPPQEVCEEVLRIGVQGELIWEHYDAGPSTKAVYGDYDQESIVWIAENYKDAVLLHLIADRFQERDQFLEWLRSKDIPVQAWAG